MCKGRGSLLNFLAPCYPIIVSETAVLKISESIVEITGSSLGACSGLLARLRKIIIESSELVVSLGARRRTTAGGTGIGRGVTAVDPVVHDLLDLIVGLEVDRLIDLRDRIKPLLRLGGITAEGLHLGSRGDLGISELLTGKLRDRNADVAALERIGDVAVVLIEHEIQDVLVDHLTEGPDTNTLVLLTTNDDRSEGTHLRSNLLRKLTARVAALVVELAAKLLDRIGLAKLEGSEDARAVANAVVVPAILEWLTIVVLECQESNRVLLALLGLPLLVTLVVLTGEFAELAADCVEVDCHDSLCVLE
jgi:hypothetical protein